MTTEEIVKALLDECKDCSERFRCDKGEQLIYCPNRDAADLITRQQAEISEKDVRIAELEEKIERLQLEFQYKQNECDYHFGSLCETKSEITRLTAFNTELQAEVDGLRADSAIQEQIIQGGSNPLDKDKIVRLILENTTLKALNTEAMELLALTKGEIQDWCGNCLYGLTDGQYCKDKSISQCSDWKWEHADRYEALKAQEGQD